MNIGWKGIFEFWSAVASFVIAVLPFVLGILGLIFLASWNDYRKAQEREQKIEEDHQNRLRREEEMRAVKYGLPKDVTPRYPGGGY
jgi:hypothetical protein